MRRALRSILIAFVVMGLATGAASAQTTRPKVISLSLSGVVDPFSASYVRSGIEKANAEGVAAVLITIDTPGGFDSSMRQITQAILDSEVPVICYVSPAGARAASAGTFILMAGSVAAMAPGTNVGAAHPVGVAGATEQAKATNDAAAYIRSIAETRGRNADWAEQAVRDSVSITAEQALDEDVIDVISPSTTALLDDVDGTTVQVAHDQTTTLTTAGAEIEELHMNPFLEILHSLFNPNIAFLFFWLGLGLIILEIFVPGGVVGTIGAIMLILSIVAFGMLPVQLVGVFLLLASAVFFVLEVKHPGIGLPAIGGLTCLVAGGLLLFDPAVPNSRVSPWVLFTVAALAAAFFGVVIQSAMRLRKMPPAETIHALVGQQGVVLRTLNPAGVIHLNAEQWTAVSEGGHIRKGSRVRVTGVDGLKLKVEPLVDETPSTETEGSEV